MRRIRARDVLLWAVMAVAFCLALAYGIAGTDYTMTEAEVIHYLEQYPSSKQLRKVAKAKGIDLEALGLGETE